jgi:hypothetical protein
MTRWHRLIRWFVLISSLLAISACGARRGLPTPIPTIPPEARLTLPPTFTPTSTPGPSPTPSVSPTATLPPTVTPTPTGTPGPTLTPTLTLTPSFTPSVTPEESATPTAEEGEESSDVPVATGCSASPGELNLLNNAGFESSQWTQDTGVNVPDAWVAFWADNPDVDWDPENNDGFKRPDMQVIERAPQYENPPRIYQGSRAFYIASGNRVFDGGIYQQVPVGQVGSLCLTGYAHAWSSQEDDPTQSTLNTENDRLNVTLQLGIDPIGGTDPWADSVVWGPPAHIYDAYQQLPGVEVYANGLTVTVFVRGSTLWRFNHNDLFFDDLSLTRVH